MKVLIVEDRVEDYNLTKDILDAVKGAHEHTRVENMTDFEKAVKTNEFDLILLDLCLPETQGMPTVLKAVKDIKGTVNDHTPIVVLTGVDDFGVSKQALKHGAKDYLIKGEFGPRELQRAINFSTVGSNNPKRSSGVFARLFSVG